MALLIVDNLSIGYQTSKGVSRAVDQVSFSIDQGGSLGFVGESGCGKTTIGMALMGLLPPNGSVLNGQIIYNGVDIVRFDEDAFRQVRGSEIAMIFQAAMNALNPVIRVDEQIVEAIQVHYPKMPPDRIQKRVIELFKLVGIPETRLKDYPHEFSGGMKQRAVIAMALACSPELIIADEPTTALDVIVQDQIIREIKQIQNQLNTSLIFISHDIAVVAQVCDHICVMYGGHIVEKGRREEVFKSPGHPYTKMLLGSYLSLDSDETIALPDACQAQAPDVISSSQTCRFFNSCQCKSKSCEKGEVDWLKLSDSHQVFCVKDGLQHE